MTLFYTRLIIWKRMKFSSVPVRYQSAVRTALSQRGYDTNGNKI